MSRVTNSTFERLTDAFKTLSITLLSDFLLTKRLYGSVDLCARAYACMCACMHAHVLVYARMCECKCVRV